MPHPGGQQRLCSPSYGSLGAVRAARRRWRKGIRSHEEARRRSRFLVRSCCLSACRLVLSCCLSPSCARRRHVANCRQVVLSCLVISLAHRVCSGPCSPLPSCSPFPPWGPPPPVMRVVSGHPCAVPRFRLISGSPRVVATSISDVRPNPAYGPPPLCGRFLSLISVFESCPSVLCLSPEVCRTPAATCRKCAGVPRFDTSTGRFGLETKKCLPTEFGMFEVCLTYVPRRRVVIVEIGL